MDHFSQLGLSQLLEGSYSKGTITIALQIPIVNWHEAIDKTTLADAIMDRLTANADQFDLKGDFLRKKNQQKNIT